MTLNLPGHQFRRSKHWLDWKDTVTTLPAFGPKEDSHASPKHDLLALHSAGTTSATFRVDPLSEEFTTLVKGHAVLGQALCPAPLYTDLALRAAKVLVKQSGEHAVEIHHLQIHSPLGLDPSRNIKLCLEDIDRQDRWIFAVKSSGGSPDTCSHAQGVLVFKASEEALRLELAPFERIVGFSRIQTLLQDPEAEVLKGRTTVYKAFSRAVTYAPYYKGVQAAYSLDLDACGTITLPKDDDSALDPILNKYDQTSMRQVNNLIVGFQTFQL